MAKHNVYLNLPWAELGKADTIITIDEDGKRLGTITISKGAFEWYPSNANQPYKLGWKTFDRMIKKHFENNGKS